MFTTIDALTFLNFDDDSLTNRDLLIELRDNAFFIFFEFMILTFAHEFLSREFVMLSSFAIRVDVEDDSKNVSDFKSSTIFFFFETIIFHFWESVFNSMNVVTTNLKISRVVCDFFTKYNRILMWRVKSIFFLFIYSHFTIWCSRDVFLILAYFAFFMFICDVEIIIARAMFFDAYFAYNDHFAVFVDMFVFLTIKALS